MPGSMPATSQLDWLISMTAMIVLFWSRATRDLLKACPGAGRGHSAGASQHSIVRCSDEVAILAARPIASLSVPLRSSRLGTASCHLRDRSPLPVRQPNHLSRPGDAGFESISLQHPVCLSGGPRGCKRKAPHFGGGLRMVGDVRRDVEGENRDSFAFCCISGSKKSRQPRPSGVVSIRSRLSSGAVHHRASDLPHQRF